MQNNPTSSPLAERMRPTNFDEFLGQQKIIGDQTLLRKSIEQDAIPSLLFWGPPGCGKTSLANLIKHKTKAHFESMSAINSGIKDVKDAISAAKIRREGLFGKKTILFIDEIHRFNKSQQDALLQAVETGVVSLIGATTENPGFEINSALLSRCQLILFSPHSTEDLKKLITMATSEHPRGLLQKNLIWQEEVMLKLIAQADGDARFLLNQVEWIVGSLPSDLPVNENGQIKISLEILSDIEYHKPLRYDKHGDEHHNLISALHKSIRGSDVQAALYWAHRMLNAGEDPKYLCRRLIRMAVEDISLADPQALIQANAALQAYEFLGLPEGVLAIDQCVVYLAAAPKSNRVYLASKKVDQTILETGMLPVPRAYRNPVNSVGRKLGYGHGYEYDHDAPNAYSGQEHLPQKLSNTVFYEPSEYGFEAEVQKRLQFLDELK